MRVLEVGGQVVSELAVVEEAVAWLDRTLPRAEMDLVDGDRLVEALARPLATPSTPHRCHANFVTSQTIDAVLGRSSAAKP